MYSTNFGFLESHEPLFFQLTRVAEQAFVPDPNTTLLKLRQLGEAIAQDVATRLGIDVDERSNQLELLRLIQQQVELGREVIDTFHAIRKIGNLANHEFVSNHREALTVLRHAWQLSCWHYRTFGDAGPDWKSGAFKTPQDPSADVRKLEERIKQLEKAAQASQRELNTAQQLAEAEQARAEELHRYLETTKEDKQVWQSLAEESEASLVEAREKFRQEKAQRLHKLDDYQSEFAIAEAPVAGFSTPSKRESPAIEEARQAIRQSYWSESEAETRLRIDEQTEILSRVKKFFAFTEQVQGRVGDAQKRLENMTQAILAKAFRGELVEQNADDEPAAELLKRIEAERENSEQLTKAAKKTASKSRRKRSTKA